MGGRLPRTLRAEVACSGKQFSYKVQHHLVTAALGVYTTDLKTNVRPQPGTQTFIAALFVTADNGKQPRRPSVTEWISRLRFLQTVEHS